MWISPVTWPSRLRWNRISLNTTIMASVNGGPKGPLFMDVVFLQPIFCQIFIKKC